MKLKFANALSLALIVAMLFTSVALADNVENDVVAGVGSISLQAGVSSSYVDVLFWVQPIGAGSDGDAGCNFDSTSESLTFTINAPSGVTASPSSLTFSKCKDGGITNGQTVRFSAGASAVSGAISFTQNSNTSGGSFNYTNADFPIYITTPPPPANTTPVVSVTGVTNGASYAKGSVPAAGCSVIDTEDGNSSFAATLSAITGTYASDGIGSQTASCSHTDTGGLTATASATYSIVDPSAPSIGYALTPSSPDGNDGWYKSNVTLVWTVTESESPSSLVKTGCVDQNITTDQGATTYSCSASSAGGAAAQVNVTIKRDATVPSITFAGPSTASWYNDDVTANWSCTDALSGPVNTSVSALASSEGSAIPATGTCVDKAGNTKSDTQSFMIDKTGPSITASATKADTTAYTADTWTNQDVTVDFICQDAGSGVASCLGDATYDTEGTFTASALATDNVGNSSTASFGPIMIDKTPPTITGEPTTLPNSNGWYNGDVTIHWTCDDALSGLAGSCPDDTVINGEGDDLTASASVNDLAGNSASATVIGIKIDRTAPTASASALPAANANGWNNSPVTVSFNGSDALSGIASCDAAVTLSSEGAGQSASGKCADKAGNVSPLATAIVNIDMTAPVIAFVGPSISSWYNADVTANWSCTDALSGPASASASATASGEGSAVPATGTCTDKAGNTRSDTQSFKIDKTAPTVAWNGSINNGDSFYFGFVPAAPTCTANDTLSGPNGCNVSGYGTTTGSHTLTATAYDVAGNSKVETRTYTVLNWRPNGFFQPVDMNGVWNTVKNGSTVPLKFELFAGTTELKLTSYVSGFTAQAVACPTTGFIADEIEVLATGGATLRFDTTGDQFIYNWQTPRRAGACYKITMTAQDGSTLTANFILK